MAMTREEKLKEINILADKISGSNYFYLTDIEGLNVQSVNKLRRICFDKGIKLEMVKNTLLRKAMEQIGEQYNEMFDSLHGSTSIMFADNGALPAKIMLDFRKKNPKPLLKAAFIDSGIFIGDDQLDTLSRIKTKNELIGDIIGLLQSPAKRVISALLAQDKMKTEE